MRYRRWKWLGLALLLAACSTQQKPDEAEKSDSQAEPAAEAEVEAESEPTAETESSEEAESQQAAATPPSANVAASDFNLDALPANAGHPRFSQDGSKLVFHAGESGERKVWVLGSGDDKPSELPGQKGDNRDPTFDRSGQRVVFASNRDGDDFDLYVQPVGAKKAERLADLPGDELHPAVNPLPFEFLGLTKDTEFGNIGEHVVETYEKVAFTRSPNAKGGPKTDQVWAMALQRPASQKPSGEDAPELADHGLHKHRMSADGQSCRSPHWSGDGQSLVFECDEQKKPVVMDAAITWGQNLAAVEKVLENYSDAETTCRSSDLEGGWRENDCVKKLPLEYVDATATAVSEPADGLRHPSVSANQSVLLATRKGKDGNELAWRYRFGDGAWQVLDLLPDADASGAASAAVWAPGGGYVAFTRPAEKGETLGFFETDFYLQNVRNLNKFPELTETRSKRLAKNHFVARPSDTKEFYAVHDTLRYRRRPQFVTADAMLQVFRDEFVRMLDRAEAAAETDLRLATKALYEHYWAQYQKTQDANDEYYAKFFATAWVPLDAAKKVKELDTWKSWGTNDPMIDQLPKTIGKSLGELPTALQKKVKDNIDRMMAHKGLEAVRVPGLADPFDVDFSQFKVRGPYAENERGAYFLAMNWLSMVPLPFNKSLVGLERTMETLQTRKKWGKTKTKKTVRERWDSIAALAGSFMGKPVDPSISHLGELADEQPDVWKKFEAKKVVAALKKKLGPVAIRDANTAGGKGRMMKVVFFPKRSGMDSVAFAKLTHPAVHHRGLARSLDAFAAFKVPAAVEHAKAAMEGQAYVDDYEKALAKLQGEFAGRKLSGTDIYHSWLATTIALAKPHDLPESSALEFARTDAWHDRKLNSALGSYTHLKHASVLYAAQDIGSQGGGSNPLLVLVERPILPQPRGFVDPEPKAFDKLAELSSMTYDAFNDGKPAEIYAARLPNGDQPHTKLLAERLADMARREVAGKPLTDADYDLIEAIGPLLEAITLGSDPYWIKRNDSRSKYGIPLVVDIHTNAATKKVREIAIGPVMDLYVAVDDGLGRRMTQGAIFSFYEFTQPMSDRLDDEQWNKMLDAGEAPDRPDWTSSFVQPVESDWE